jgi:methylmalonyl-CoA mutase N-terminal domain/subunit
LKDIEEIFDGIPLDSLSEAGTVANAIGPIALSWFIALAEKQGIPFTQFKIGLQNDSLKEFVGRGTYIFPVKESLRLSVDVVEWIAKNAPHWHPLEIGGTVYRWGGCTATQEIAFAVAVAIAYIEAALARGLSIDDFAPNLELHLTTDNDIFEEAAKFRALRRFWAKMMAERFGAKRIESLKLTGSINCAGYSCTAQQPLNNIVRLTLHSLGALLGGVECLNTPSFDEALGIPTPEAMAVALRTQQILAHETGIANTIDPLAGSYYVESLTNEMEARCAEYIKRIDEMGGALAAIEKGFMHREIEEAAYRFQREVERGDRVVVGVNKFESSEPTQVKIFKVDPGVERRVQDKFASLKLQRDSRAVEETLRQLKVAAAGEGNLVRPITEAVKVYATTGEICDALREVFGEYRERPAYV